MDRQLFSRPRGPRPRKLGSPSATARFAHATPSHSRGVSKTLSGISNDCCLPTCSTTMRTGVILDWRRTRQYVVQKKFALRVKARFNPFRDSAGCTIAVRWQRRLQGNSCEDKTFLPVTRQRRGSHFLRASFAGRRISPQSKTEYLRQVERNPCEARRNDLAKHRRIQQTGTGEIRGKRPIVTVCTGCE